MPSRDPRQQRPIVAAELKDHSAAKRRADTGTEEIAPCAAAQKLRTIAKRKVAELKKSVGEDASPAHDGRGGGGHLTTPSANSRARASASGSFAGSLPPAWAICGRPP